jgi:hypothetical protein
MVRRKRARSFSSKRKIYPNQINLCVRNADLRCGHKGLTELASDYGFNVDTFKPGQFAAFVNRSVRSVKVLCANNVLLYYKCKTGNLVEGSTGLELIPQFMASGNLKIEKRLKTMLLEALDSYRNERRAKSKK